MQEYVYKKYLLGTDVTLALIATNKQSADVVAGYTLEQIRYYEQKFSRFSPTSELTELNLTKQLTVSPDFLAVLERSLELTTITDGIFNPLVQVAKLGYRTSFPSLQDITPEIDISPSDVDITHIHIDRSTRLVTLGQNQKLDFGGMLKGYLAEKLSKQIAHSEPSISGNIINLGGDLYTSGTDENGEPFICYIENPITKDEIPIALQDASLVTSGTYARFWQTTAGERNHLIDTKDAARTTYDNISASIISKSGSEAEALAKVLLTEGVEDLEKYPGAAPYSYVLITKSGECLTNFI